MGFFDKLFGKKPSTQDAVDLIKGSADKVTKVPSTPKEKKVKEPELSAKEKATLAGEPYINVLSMDIDPVDMNNGAFELDWNDKFIINLIKSGYKQRDDDTDQIMVDRWFQNVCRNVALEIYEQQQADPENRYRAEMRVVRNKDLGDGRTEVS
jgi:hypothetical protein